MVAMTWKHWWPLILQLTGLVALVFLFSKVLFFWGAGGFDYLWLSWKRRAVLTVAANFYSIATFVARRSESLRCYLARFLLASHLLRNISLMLMTVLKMVDASTWSLKLHLSVVKCLVACASRLFFSKTIHQTMLLKAVEQITSKIQQLILEISITLRWYLSTCLSDLLWSNF